MHNLWYIICTITMVYTSGVLFRVTRHATKKVSNAKRSILWLKNVTPGVTLTLKKKIHITWTKNKTQSKHNKTPPPQKKTNKQTNKTKLKLLSSFNAVVVSVAKNVTTCILEHRLRSCSKSTEACFNTFDHLTFNTDNVNVQRMSNKYPILTGKYFS